MTGYQGKGAEWKDMDSKILKKLKYVLAAQNDGGFGGGVGGGGEVYQEPTFQGSDGYGYVACNIGPGFWAQEAGNLTRYINQRIPDFNPTAYNNVIKELILQEIEKKKYELSYKRSCQIDYIGPMTQGEALGGSFPEIDINPYLDFQPVQDAFNRFKNTFFDIPELIALDQTLTELVTNLELGSISSTNYLGLPYIECKKLKSIFQNPNVPLTTKVALVGKLKAFKNALPVVEDFPFPIPGGGTTLEIIGGANWPPSVIEELIEAIRTSPDFKFSGKWSGQTPSWVYALTSEFSDTYVNSNWFTSFISQCFSLVGLGTNPVVQKRRFQDISINCMLEILNTALANVPNNCEAVNNRNDPRNPFNGKSDREIWDMIKDCVEGKLAVLCRNNSVRNNPEIDAEA